MTALRRFVPGRRVYAVAALAPLCSLLTSRLLAIGIGATNLGRALPPGVHTYEPAVNLVGMDLLVLVSAIVALGGISVLVLSRRPAGDRRWPLVRAVAVLVCAQLLFYAAQAALVAQVQGIPDSGAVIAVALALQLGLVLAAMAATRVAVHLFRVEPWLATRAGWLAVATHPRSCVLPASPALVLLGGSRRGPPRPLLAR